MKLLVLDGSYESMAFSDVVWKAIQDIGAQRGFDTERMTLRDLTIAPCLGCFACWMKTPGVCVIDDDGREVAKRIVQSDLVIYATPVVFGGYSAVLKTALDRSIGILSPMFRVVRGEIHHKKRYARYPRLAAIGWLPNVDLEQEDVFETLIQRNALNMWAPRAAACVLPTSQSPDALLPTLEQVFGEVMR